MAYKILWIEDGAFVHLAELARPIQRSSSYFLDISSTISEAVELMGRDRYDVVIVDIRVPPGEGREWVELYQARGHVAEARLGLELLKSLLSPTLAKVKIDVPAWLKPEHLAVFTVDSVLEREVKALGVQVFRQKSIRLDRASLLEIIEEVIALGR